MPKDMPVRDSLAKFTNNPKRFLERLRKSGEPILLTLDDEGGVVVQDAAAYQRLRQLADQLETIEAVKESLRDQAAGRTRPMREALDDLAAKHKLPRLRKT
jgi:PHD/YefM family antitoxin component YafN of YafNO toxin-antitoxin module